MSERATNEWENEGGSILASSVNITPSFQFLPV